MEFRLQLAEAPERFVIDCSIEDQENVWILVNWSEKFLKLYAAVLKLQLIYHKNVKKVNRNMQEYWLFHEKIFSFATVWPPNFVEALRYRQLENLLKKMD